jgi:LmbE family N-acetylglucosaminyl deacetylase
MTNRAHRSGEVTESLESPIEAVKQSFLFVSPHLDDAVLSCGALIAHLAPLTSVTVATIFTHDAPGPHTRSARKSARQCGWTHSAELFEERRKEDAKVLTEAGASHVNLGFLDALFRRRPAAAGSDDPQVVSSPNLSTSTPPTDSTSRGTDLDSRCGCVRPHCDIHLCRS